MYIPVEHEHIPLVVIDNFLPRDYVTRLYEDFIKLKPHFGIPHWSGGYNNGPSYNPNDPVNPLCTGHDVWLPFDKDKVEKNKDLGFYLSNLNKYIYLLCKVKCFKIAKYSHSLSRVDGVYKY